MNTDYWEKLAKGRGEDLIVLEIKNSKLKELLKDGFELLNSRRNDDSKEWNKKFEKWTAALATVMEDSAKGEGK